MEVSQPEQKVWDLRLVPQLLQRLDIVRIRIIMELFPTEEKVPRQRKEATS